MLRVQLWWEEAADRGDNPWWRRGLVTGTRAGDIEECASFSDEEGCTVGYDEDEVFDRASFSRLLKKVPLAEVKGYSKISQIQATDQFVTNIAKGRGYSCGR